MLLAEAQKTSASNAGVREPLPPLSELEAEVIGLFVQLARMVGLPRSYAEIYGLLFISPQPLAMDHVIERLGISKGSASQGLKFLRDLEAVNMVYVPHDRRLHYEAVAEARNFGRQFLRGHLLPQLDSGISQIERVSEKLKSLPAEQRRHMTRRITLLQSWEKKTRRLLPIVLKLMG